MAPKPYFLGQTFILLVSDFVGKPIIPKILNRVILGKVVSTLLGPEDNGIKIIGGKGQNAKNTLTNYLVQYSAVF